MLYDYADGYSSDSTDGNAPKGNLFGAHVYIPSQRGTGGILWRSETGRGLEFGTGPELGRVCDHWTAKPGRNGKVPLLEIGRMMIGSKMIYEPQRPKVGDGPGRSETEFSRNWTGSGKTEVWWIVRDGPDGPKNPEFGVRLESECMDITAQLQVPLSTYSSPFYKLNHSFYIPDMLLSDDQEEPLLESSVEESDGSEDPVDPTPQLPKANNVVPTANTATTPFSIQTAMSEVEHPALHMPPMFQTLYPPPTLSIQNDLHPCFSLLMPTIIPTLDELPPFPTNTSLLLSTKQWPLLQKTAIILSPSMVIIIPSGSPTSGATSLQNLPWEASVFCITQDWTVPAHKLDFSLSEHWLSGDRKNLMLGLIMHRSGPALKVLGVTLIDHVQIRTLLTCYDEKQAGSRSIVAQNRLAKLDEWRQTLVKQGDVGGHHHLNGDHWVPFCTSCADNIVYYGDSMVSGTDDEITMPPNSKTHWSGWYLHHQHLEQESMLEPHPTPERTAQLAMSTSTSKSQSMAKNIMVASMSRSKSNSVVTHTMATSTSKPKANSATKKTAVSAASTSKPKAATEAKPKRNKTAVAGKPAQATAGKGNTKQKKKTGKEQAVAKAKKGKGKAKVKAETTEDEEEPELEESLWEQPESEQSLLEDDQDANPANQPSKIQVPDLGLVADNIVAAWLSRLLKLLMAEEQRTVEIAQLLADARTEKAAAEVKWAAVQTEVDKLECIERLLLEEVSGLAI
ncbi:hypothetical protein C8R44DRAFT_749976 [Mycena epipterygia]|nr:hypothetical protein C8R44DRAFT_749976 [Mycena epipterygia]